MKFTVNTQFESGFLIPIIPPVSKQDSHNGSRLGCQLPDTVVFGKCDDKYIFSGLNV